MLRVEKQGARGAGCRRDRPSRSARSRPRCASCARSAAAAGCCRGGRRRIGPPGGRRRRCWTAKRPERERLMITSATESWPVERFALRFVIDGAGEALMLGVRRVGAGMIADQIGERAALVALGRGDLGSRSGKAGAIAWVATGCEDFGLGEPGRRSGIFEVVETEILCGQAAGGMLDIGRRSGSSRLRKRPKDRRRRRHAQQDRITADRAAARNGNRI